MIDASETLANDLAPFSPDPEHCATLFARWSPGSIGYVITTPDGKGIAASGAVATLGEIEQLAYAYAVPVSIRCLCGISLDVVKFTSSRGWTLEV